MTTSSIPGADGLSAGVTFSHLPHFGIFFYMVGKSTVVGLSYPASMGIRPESFLTDYRTFLGGWQIFCDIGYFINFPE